MSNSEALLNWYQDLQFFAHPDTINHPVVFADGSREWKPIKPAEKRWYQTKLDQHHQDYANFLNS